MRVTDGTVTITGLVPGSTVVVSESSVPSGYVLDTTPQTIIVKNGVNSMTSGGTVTNPGSNNNGKYNINKNVLVIGGSGSGKTRFHIKPNLMQMNASYIVTDPKGSI